MNSTEQLYNEMFKFIVDKTLNDGYGGLELASVMVAQALTIYKTILSEDEFNGMVLEIYNSRDRIKKLELPDVTIQ